MLLLYFEGLNVVLETLYILFQKVILWSRIDQWGASQTNYIFRRLSVVFWVQKRHEDFVRSLTIFKGDIVLFHLWIDGAQICICSCEIDIYQVQLLHRVQIFLYHELLFGHWLDCQFNFECFFEIFSSFIKLLLLTAYHSQVIIRHRKAIIRILMFKYLVPDNLMIIVPIALVFLKNFHDLF